MPGFETNSMSVCALKTSTPWGASLSVASTRYVMAVLRSRRADGRHALGENGLRRSDAGAEGDAMSVLRERELERRDRGHDVEAPDVAEMRDADDFALQLILAASERDADLVAQIADDLSGDALREVDAGDRRARRVGRDEPEPERRPRRAR